MLGTTLGTVVQLRSCSTSIPWHAGEWRAALHPDRREGDADSYHYFPPLVPAPGIGFLRCVVVRPYMTAATTPCLLPPSPSLYSSPSHLQGGFQHLHSGAID